MEFGTISEGVTCSEDTCICEAEDVWSGDDDDGMSSDGVFFKMRLICPFFVTPIDSKFSSERLLNCSKLS